MTYTQSAVAEIETCRDLICHFDSSCEFDFDRPHDGATRATLDIAGQYAITCNNRTSGVFRFRIAEFDNDRLESIRGEFYRSAITAAQRMCHVLFNPLRNGRQLNAPLHLKFRELRELRNVKQYAFKGPQSSISKLETGARMTMSVGDLDNLASAVGMRIVINALGPMINADKQLIESGMPRYHTVLRAGLRTGRDLKDLRKSLSELSQTKVGAFMNRRQPAITKLEQREDPNIEDIRGYLQAIGLGIEIIASDGSSTFTMLQEFLVQRAALGLTEDGRSVDTAPAA